MLKVSYWNKPLQSYTFVEALVLVVVGWVLIDVWIRYNNALSTSLGFDRNSPSDTFVWAFGVTLILLIGMVFAGPLVLDIYNMSDGINVPSSVGPESFI